MQNLVNTYLEKFKNERRTRHRLTCILLALALVVGTGVYWQLRLTGAAATNETFCGLEEHTHSEDCYEQALTCGLEESEGHTHTDACYETETSLVCGLEESEGHTHDDSCYDEDGNLICGKEESEGHTHDDSCYETEQVLVCGEEESEGHTHTEDCYEEQLVCDMVEHTHTVECLINETADVETADDWEATLPALTGVWAEDVVAIAKSQLGYTESTANFTLDDDGETRRGYTRYGAWAGNEYGDWDAMFVSFCLHYAGISRSDFPEATGAYSWVATLKEKGLYEGSDYTAAAGDLVFFDSDEDGKADHVGIVTEVNEKNGKLTVIEGDCEDAVTKNTYAADDSTIIGYGTVAEAQGLEDEDSAAEESVEAEAETAAESEAETEAESEAKTEAESEAESEIAAEAESGNESESEAETETEDGATLIQQTLTATVDSVTITVSGLLPEEAAVTATPVEVENDELNIVLAFDISIYNADGTVFEPENDTISVTIQSDEIGAGNGVYYISDDGDAEKMESEAEEGAVAFEAKHFSVYAVTSSDTVIASGTIDNAAGDADAITWTIYEDDAGEQTLVISGTGAIPDYTSGTLTPWYSYCNTTGKTLKLVIEEGITAVGKYAFHQSYLSEVSFPDTLTSIGDYAFCYSRVLTSVVIPDSVTYIGASAFQYSNIVEITLGSNVETIGSFAFYSSASGSTVIYIPDSVKSIGADAFNLASAYEISDSNITYKVIDGVLYSYDETTLIDFPKQKVLDTYTVPDSVTTIAVGALRYVKYVNNLIINHAVTFANSGYSMSNSNYQYIYLADGIEITGNDAFYDDPNLSELRLPEGTRFTFNVSSLQGDSSLTYLKIPDGTTSLQNQSLSGLTSLETLYYDAKNASSIASNVFGGTSGISYDLIVGTSVDTLPVGFNYLATRAETLNFEGPNAIYVTEGALDSAPRPFTGISGWIYVDEYGAVYQLDVDSDTATLIYVPGNVTEYTVPTSFTVSGESDSDVNGTYKITAVASNALKYADSLTGITFADVSQVTLEAYALANCETLTSVTDSKTEKTATTVSGAETLGFESVGKNAFYNTGLTDEGSSVLSESTLDGSKEASAALTNTDGSTIAYVNVSVTDGGTWTASDDEEESSGGYVALTGQTMTVNINASNTSGSAQTYRVYLTATDEDFQMNYSAGQTFTITSGTTTVTVTCFQDPDDPYTVYFEFTLDVGQTINFNVTTNYLSGSSDGGGLTVTSAIMETTKDEDGATTVTGTEASSTSSLQLWWKTERDSYTLAKTNSKTGNSSQTSVAIAADEDGAYLAENLKYTITLTQDEDKNSSLGEDYVTSVTYTDVLTLPDGVAWTQEVLDAITEGTYTRSTGNETTFSVNGTTIVTLKMTSNSGLALQKASLSVDEDGNVILTWTVKNIGSVNLYNNTFDLTIHSDALEITLSSDDEAEAVFDADNATVTNTVTSKVNYTYSESVESESSADKTLTVSNGSIAITKTAENSVTYFGEDLTYTVSVSNSGATDYTYSVTDKGDYILTDTLPDMVYLKAENMETMFRYAAEQGTPLTITITGAVLGANKTVKDADNSENTAYVNSGNTSSDTETTGNTITITYDKTTETYSIAVTDSEGNTVSIGTSSGGDLESLLQGIGYGVTRSAVYTCTWTLAANTTYSEVTETSNTFTLRAGETLTYSILSTVKTTFQYLQDSDWPGRYPDESAISFKNETAALKGPADKQIAKSASVTNSAKREAIISKSVYDSEGNNLSSALSAGDDDVLTYELTFTHYGSGTYDDLPMVDDLYGSQYLLVPYSSNASLSCSEGSTYEAYDADGDETYDYYILKSGTFYNVVVGTYTISTGTTGTLIASQITVTENDGEQEVVLNDTTYSYTGIHTQIWWYFDELEGGNYTITVDYDTLVDYGSAASYTLGNVVWMNDRDGSRIYASLWGGGTIIDYDKEIVTSDTDTSSSSDDEIDEDDLSEVGEGDTVTYRLTLRSSGDAYATFTLTGANIADALPSTFGTFKWSKDNVSITNVIVETTGDGNGVSGADSLKTNSNWSIETSWNNLSSEGQYYIIWDDNVSVTFTGTATVYIYVTLTFPSDTTDASGNTDTTWSEYVDAVAGTTLSNTFYVYRNPAVVNHILKEEGSAKLTKGVYALARSASDAVATSNNLTFYATGSSRDYYNNQDSNYRYIYYYVELYNGASSRLYINDLYDLLPDGFTYVTLINGSNAQTRTDGAIDYLTKTNVIVTMSSGDSSSKWLIDRDGATTYMSATVSARTDTDGNPIFTISSGSGTYAIAYDEEMGQYYLDSDQSIVFGFICQIGEYDETENKATNTIAMSYTDYTGAGNVNVAENHSVSGYDFSVLGESQYSGDTNDGSCEVCSSEKVCFDDGNGNSQWLVSEVTVERGGIVPGISKKTVSYQLSESENATAYTTSVTPGAIVNWEATLSNSGTMTIYNYTVTDVMPSPFVYTGDVTYAIVNSSGAEVASGTLFSFPGVSDLKSLSTGDTVTVTYTDKSGGTATAELKVGGDAVTLETRQQNSSSATVELTVKIYLDDSGNVVMEIGFTDMYWAIPEGGYILLDYSSYNPSGVHANATYINEVTLTPNSQTFTNIQTGKKTSDGTGVYATSPVTVATGFSTNAYKSVTQKDADSTDGTNYDTAHSYSDDNYITLTDVDSVFTYTLTVENTTGTTMDSLVLIDNLPAEEDTYTFNTDVKRGSAFAAQLASADFTVTITTTTTDADGNETPTTETLSSGNYSVQGSTKESGFDEDDKKGNASSDWFEITEANLSTVKSIRIIISDYEIPAGTTVSVSFDAKVSGTAEAGTIAWNNFGYTYTVTSGGSEISLEAMPLEVGVQVPSAPELCKSLVDLSDEAYTVTEDTEFIFVVYEGDELTDTEGNSYTSQKALEDALEALKTDSDSSNDRAYKVVTITVKEDSSSSGSVSLSGEDWSDWTWTDGETYTITEFLEDETYVFKRWSATNTTGGDVAGGNSYTFTYDREKTLYLTCENTYQLWSLELTKVDADSYDEDTAAYTDVLKNAIFALYVQDESQKMSEEDYNGLTDKPAETITVGEGESTVIWYLHSVKTTDKNGTIDWTGLTEDSYYLVEVKAPDGYNLDAAPRLVRRDANNVSITATNEPGYELPKSGGSGTWMYSLIGLILCCGTAAIIFRRRKFI